MVSEYTIIIDSREKNDLWTKSTKNQKIIKRKLDTGDYSIEVDGVDWSDRISIERKNGIDAISTISSGHKRFKKEIARALELDYFAIIIECSHTAMLEKSFEGAHYSKMKGYVANSILSTISVKYGVHLIYTNGRIETKHIIKDLFNSYYKIHKVK